MESNSQINSNKKSYAAKRRSTRYSATSCPINEQAMWPMVICASRIRYGVFGGHVVQKIYFAGQRAAGSPVNATR
jgi:hypothetical protein